jgi:hypothetical protein
MFCAAGLVFDGIDGVGSHFHVLRCRISFRRCEGRRVPFSCFAHSDSFSAVPRASAPVFMFCAPGLIFGGTVGVNSHFHVLRARTRFLPYGRVSGPVFMFCAPGHVFGGAEGIGSRFHVLRSRTRFWPNRGRRLLIFGDIEGVRSGFHVLRTRTHLHARTHFRQYRGRRVSFSYFAFSDMFFVLRTA